MQLTTHRHAGRSVRILCLSVLGLHNREYNYMYVPITHVGLTLKLAALVTHADDTRGNKAFSGVCVCVILCVCISAR